MPRLALLVLALALTSCTDSHGHLTPDGAFDEAQEALAQGEARRALGLLKSAANRNHLGALETLAFAYGRGYLQARSTPSTPAVNVPIWAWPWEEKRWLGAYDAEVERRVAAGDPAGLYVRVNRLQGNAFRDSRWGSPSEADLAEARSILLDLAEQGDTKAMIHLGFAAMGSDREAGAAWFRKAQDAGNPQGCWYRFYFIDRMASTFSAADLAPAIDRAEACRKIDPDPGDDDYSARTIGALRVQAAEGNPAAAAQLDSLRALGVFQRHPRLEEV